MIVSLTIIRYPKKFIPFAFLAMAVHRLPLFLTKECSFWKLLGCGKNGTFDINPDYQQWGLMAVWDKEESFRQFQANSFVAKWWKWFGEEQWTVLLAPTEAHGKWSGKEPFGQPKIKGQEGRVGVLTRATIRPTQLKNFWKNVPKVSAIMGSAKGFITSVGIGEAPFFMQATFSVWESLDDVKQFAYRDATHAEIIKKTRQENWYSEELFARFSILKSEGSLMGIDPLDSKIKP
jgi:heme-degrading monooxygenase HmoA